MSGEYDAGGLQGVTKNAVIIPYKGSDSGTPYPARHEPVTVWYRILSYGFPPR